MNIHENNATDENNAEKREFEKDCIDCPETKTNFSDDYKKGWNDRDKQSDLENKSIPKNEENEENRYTLNSIEDLNELPTVQEGEVTQLMREYHFDTLGYMANDSEIATWYENKANQHPLSQEYKISLKGFSEDEINNAFGKMPKEDKYTLLVDKYSDLIDRYSILTDKYIQLLTGKSNES